MGFVALAAAMAQRGDVAPPAAMRIELTSEQRAALATYAARFVQTMAHGSEMQTSPVLRSLYRTDDEFSYARRALLGPSEAPDGRGFREILRAMTRLEVLPGDAYVGRRDGSSRIVATVVVFDPTATSPDAILADQNCLQHRLAYLAQQFSWNGTAWEPCCHLFFDETDGPCGCCDDN